MDKEKVSIISTFVNVLLGASKLFVGLLSNSATLIADGIHSTLDVLSSFVTFLGIRSSQKPADVKHPYGHYAKETLAGLIVALLLAVTGGWIIYEGITQLISPEEVDINMWGYAVVIASIVINEVMARIKFRYGKEGESLALIGDAKHSRADAISSVGVLAGLFLIRFFPAADGILAILIGIYILKESLSIGKEVSDNLVGVRDVRTEEKIKKVCQDMKIPLDDVKTKKIGPAVFGELSLGFDPRMKLDEAETISKKLQDKLLADISELKYVVVKLESHNLKEGAIKPEWSGFGRGSGRFRFRQKRGGFIEEMGPPKEGYRIAIPVKDNEIYKDFGAPEYLIIDKKDGKIVHKETISNPSFSPEQGWGMRMVRSVKPDEIITKSIGEGARENAEGMGIKITVIQKDKKLADIIK